MPIRSKLKILFFCFLIIFSPLYTLGSFVLPVNANITSSLLGHWTMDESSWNGTSGEVIDTGSGGNNGTAVGGISTTSGYISRAGNLNSTGYVQLANTVQLDAGDFTIAAWFKFSGSYTGANLRQIWSSGYDGVSNQDLEIIIQDNKVVTDARDTNITDHTLTSTNTVNDNLWHHVAYARVGNVFTLYVDGVANDTQTFSLGDVDTAGTVPRIGNGQYNINNREFPGLIDDVRVYNRGLSASDVGQLSYDLSLGLAGHWKMNESVWNGTAGEVRDASGHGNNGTRVGDATTTSSGKFGRAGAFDNSGDYVTMSNTSQLDMTGYGLTISAWIYDYSPANYDFIVDKQDGVFTGPGYAFYVYGGCGGGLAFDLRGTEVTTCGDVPANTWVHVVATYDGATKYIYVNGVAHAGQNVSGPLISSSHNFVIGESVTSDHYFNGLIDDVRIYDRALSPGEITQLYSVSEGNQFGAGNGSVLSGGDDAGYYTKVTMKPDGFPLVMYYSLQEGASDKAHFVDCNDLDCTTYTNTTIDTDVAPVGSWGLLYFKSDGKPVYISRDKKLQGTLSRLDCDDAGCTSSTFTSSIFPKTVGYYGPVAGAERPSGVPFFAMDGSTGLGGILDSFTCATEACTSGTRRTLVSGISAGGTNPSVAVLADNRPVVSFFDPGTHSLRLYVCANAGCTSGTASTLHTGSADAEYGRINSIIIRADGTPGIAYSTPKGLRFYDCPNEDCTGGSVSTNSYSVHDEGTGSMTANFSGAMIQLDANDNPVILNTAARRRGSDNVSIYQCYNTKCSEGRFRTLVLTEDKLGLYGNLFLRADGGFVVPYRNTTSTTSELYDTNPTYSSVIDNVDSGIEVKQLSRVNPMVSQTSSYSDPQTENFSTAVVDLRVQKPSGVPIADFTESFNEDGNMNFINVFGDSDAVLGKSVIAHLGTAPGADPGHTLYVPKRSQDEAVHICPNALVMADVTSTCSGGYNLTSGNGASIVNIGGNYYWKIAGLTGTGGLGVDETNGSIGLTLTPNSVGVSTGTDIIAHWTPAGELSGTQQAAVDFPSSFTLSNTCSTVTTDADSDSTTDGAATITTWSGGPRYLYTFTAGTTMAGFTGLDFCIHVTSPATSGNYPVNAFDSLGGYGTAFIYVGNENQLNITATVDNVLTFVIRNSADTADLSNVGGLPYGPNLCDLGNLNTAGVQTCSYRLKVATNAINGYTVYIATDGSLRNSTNTAFLPNISAGTLVTSGTANYGIAFNAGHATGDPIGGISVGGSFATDDSPTATAITTGISDTLYTSNTVNNPSTTDTTNTALVTHRAEADSGTPAGTYKQLVTYTVSASF